MNKGKVRESLQESLGKSAFVDYISSESEDGTGYQVSRVQGVVDMGDDQGSVVTMTNGKQRVHFDYGSVGIVAVGHSIE